ncbi:MAG: hypothetical protein KGQ58_06355 [Proteobacteria bacterium]|nr:hypothetical protein [Pseudomonadota bacterium]MDE3208270.1 hypothetical protein [Pseudomonadota bacterium]
MRYVLVLLSLLFCLPALSFADTRISIGIALPGTSIGINMPYYPQLTPIPGYPVYYDPAANYNFFFYDGLYWVFRNDHWYSSSWYNGPWYQVNPYNVPAFILRIPIRYYRRPPVFFHDWDRDGPPRWGAFWGHDWDRRRQGWDRWNPHNAPHPAPLPQYQRAYSGRHYPHEINYQDRIRSQHYRFQPHDSNARQYYYHQHESPQMRHGPQQEQQHAYMPMGQPQQHYPGGAVHHGGPGHPGGPEHQGNDHQHGHGDNGHGHGHEEQGPSGGY